MTEKHVNKKPTIDDLRITTGLRKAEFLKEANVSIPTYRRMRLKDPSVGVEMYYRCLNLINRLQGTNYTLDDIEH